MKTASLILFGLAASTLAGCAPQNRTSDKGPVSPAVRVTGPAQSCVPLLSVRSTSVRDNRTIDFKTSGRRGFRNTLPNDCPGLRSGNNGFTYATSLSQLCSSDIIYPLENYGGTLQRGAGCGLGQFVPVEFER
jgi:hypothetical protein